MSEYKAYFDESGCHDGAAVLAVGGYLVRADWGRRMERKWKATLNKYALPYFHMVDCAHGNGVFRSLTKQQRIEVESRMIALIKNHTELGFVAVVNPNRFSEIHPVPDAYTFCVNACLMAICAWFSDKPNARIEFIFESGHRNGKKADRHLMNHRRKEDPDISRVYESHRFADKASVSLLQAADLLVWQSAKFMSDKVSNTRKPRADFMSLMQHPTSFGYVVLHKGTLALSIDNQPGVAGAERDLYLRAMFSNGPDDTAVLETYHAKMAAMNAQGRVRGDFSTTKRSSGPDS